MYKSTSSEKDTFKIDGKQNLRIVSGYKKLKKLRFFCIILHIVYINAFIKNNEQKLLITVYINNLLFTCMT